MEGVHDNVSALIQNEKENSENDLNQIEVKFNEGKWKMNSSNIELQKC